MDDLLPIAARVGAKLKAHGQTIAIAESSGGGLISAALLAVPGASAYFLGGSVVYTLQARENIAGITKDQMQGIRSSSEPYAELLARSARAKLDATWGLAETGAAGPSGNRYGDPAGHTCIAVTGPREMVLTYRTASSDRVANMRAFARKALETIEEALDQT
ncbi:MAG: CinA family protein [Alphaproteobacteria bacterium]|nr:CinA family protein [Alphaproteobacteria bacterium]